MLPMAAACGTRPPKLNQVMMRPTRNSRCTQASFSLHSSGVPSAPMANAIAGEAGGHPFMVEQELSSDCQGAQFMRGAGYDPGDTVKFWTANVSSEGGQFYATHPSTPRRLSALRTCIAALPSEPARKNAALAALH